MDILRPFFPPKVAHATITINGSGALSGKMLFVRITENNIIDAYFRSG